MTTNLKVETNEDSDQESDSIFIELQQASPLKTSFSKENRDAPSIVDIHVYDYELTKSLISKTEKYSFQYAMSNDISTSKPPVFIKQERTGHDFEWLISTIKVKYPGIGLPVYNIPHSELNLAKQKCLIAQMFLTRLCEHPILKHCPELKIFFLDKLQFVEKKKAIDASGFEFKGLSTETLSSHLNNLIKNKYKQSKELNWPSQLKQLLDVQKQLVNTINHLQICADNLRSQYRLNNELIKKESGVLSGSNSIQQFAKEEESIRAIVGQNVENKKSMLSESYLKEVLIVMIVLENLRDYHNVFQQMIALQRSIDSNAYSTDYQKFIISQRYLQLLLNNLEDDTKDWLLYNNNLINNIG